jgi:hypothetical protein
MEEDKLVALVWFPPGFLRRYFIPIPLPLGSAPRDWSLKKGTLREKQDKSVWRVGPVGDHDGIPEPKSHILPLTLHYALRVFGLWFGCACSLRRRSRGAVGFSETRHGHSPNLGEPSTG